MYNKSLFYKRIDEEIKGTLPKLDVKDRKILSLLVDNSRMPLTQLRKNVSLSRDSIKYRIQKMRKKGIILEFIPLLNFKNFGYQDFHIYLVIDETDSEKKIKFIESLKQKEYVRKMIEYSDRYDFELIILAKDVYDFDDKVTDITSEFPEIVLEKEKMIVLKGYYSNRIPKNFQRQVGIEAPISFSPQRPMELDRYDYKISLSPWPYDVHLFTTKLILDLHKNIQGELQSRLAVEQYRHMDSLNVNREIFSYEIGFSFKLLF